MQENLQKIFKAYDIRGIYPEEINEEICERIGKAFADFVDAKEIIVGQDMRLSSQSLVNAFCTGIVSQGKNCRKIGQVSTDAVYFSSGIYDLPGVMFTASHNPKEWNGIKMCHKKAFPIGEDTGLKEILALAVKNEFQEKKEKGQEVFDNSLLAKYIEFCLTFVKKQNISKLKIAVDAGNGMAGKIIPLLYKDLNCEIIPMFFELNGSFPNHQPSPIEPENTKDLAKKIVETKADFGLAFDGDSDRVFFLDNLGKRVPSSIILALLSKYLLKKYPAEKIIYNLVCSKTVPETISRFGGEPKITKVGHSFIKEIMKKENAILGGEHSGHYYFRDNFFADSAMIAALIITEVISDYQGPFSELVKQFEKYYSIEETNFNVENKERLMKRFSEIYKENLKYDFDGLTFDFEDWWFNLRPSNTEPKLRLNMEAVSEKLLNEKFKEISGMIKKEA